MENPMKDKLYDDVMAEVFRDDPALAVESLNTLLEEGCTQGELLVILRQLAQAQGGISQISARAGLNEKSLYRTLSGQGNPRLSSLNAILHALGLRLAVVPQAQSPHPETAPQTSPADAAAVAA